MKQILLLSCTAAVLSGCAVTLAPHVPYLPMIRDRGQAEVRVSTGFSGSELQAGYQITDRLVAHTSLLMYGRAQNDSKVRSADLGLGYYYNSPNGFWRLGMHGGLASGGGKSTGGGGSFESVDPPTPVVDYRVRYTYAYVQPTVHLLEGRQIWSFGLRVGQAYYHRFTQVGADTLGGQVRTVNYGGRQLTFLQAVLQYGYRVSPWINLSTTFGAQNFLGNRGPIDVGMSSNLVGQVGVHLTLKQLPKLRP